MDDPFTCYCCLYYSLMLGHFQLLLYLNYPNFLRQFDKNNTSVFIKVFLVSLRKPTLNRKQKHLPYIMELSLHAYIGNLKAINLSLSFSLSFRYQIFCNHMLFILMIEQTISQRLSCIDFPKLTGKLKVTSLKCPNTEQFLV